MWYRALGIVMAAIETNCNRAQLRQEIEASLSVGDSERIRELLSGCLTCHAAYLCFEEGLYKECDILDRGIVSGELGDYATSYNEQLLKLKARL